MWRNKVLWTEGLFLRPQHFQQQERYFEQIVDRRSKAMASWTWGFESLEIDEASLTLGKLALRSAAGVLPDGTVFAVPQDDLPPPALDVGAIAAAFGVRDVTHARVAPDGVRRVRARCT